MVWEKRPRTCATHLHFELSRLEKPEHRFEAMAAQTGGSMSASGGERPERSPPR